VRGARPAPFLPRGVAVPQIAGGSYFTLDWNPRPSHGGSHESGSGRDFASSASTFKQWRSFTFPGAIPDSVPSFVFGESHPRPFSLVRHPHAQASVASTLVSVASPLRHFAHEDSSSASDLTMSFWPSSSAAVGGGVPSPLPMGDALLRQQYVPPGGQIPPTVTMGGAIPPPLPAPMGGIPVGGICPPPPMGGFPMGGPIPHQVPLPHQPMGGPTLPPAPLPVGGGFPSPVAPVPSIQSVEPLKLPPIKGAKSYPDFQGIIQYYLRRPEFSTQPADNALVTDSTNAKASCFWEGQIHVTVQEGSLHFLFQNKGSLYDGKGFKMLDALNQHCHPDSVANAFTILTSLFNDRMGDTEEIVAFCSHFDGMVSDMTRCKITIPQILLVMFFLWSLPQRYDDLLDQFRSRYKDLESASIDSIVADVRFHDEFKVVESDKKPPAGKLPRATTTSTNTDRQGKVWNNSFEWLAQLHINSMKKRWKRALAGSGICPICNREGDEHKHVPANCPLLKELNLKLIRGPPTTPTLPANAPAPVTAVANPGGRSAVMDDTSATGSSGLGNVPSGLMAVLAEEDFPSDDEWCLSCPQK
jgi:hypothetical protein